MRSIALRHAHDGFWISYGLGSQSSNLPGTPYSTQDAAQAEAPPSGKAGSSPPPIPAYFFVQRGTGTEFGQPQGTSTSLQQKGLSPSILSTKAVSRKFTTRNRRRIAAYELAGRMQVSAPELNDLSKESTATLEAYGLNRPEPKGIGGRGKAVKPTRISHAIVSWPAAWSNEAYASSTPFTPPGITTVILIPSCNTTREPSTSRLPL